ARKIRAGEAARLVQAFSLRRSHCSIRQGERSVQLFSACLAQAVGLSLWQMLHGLGILYSSVSAGVMKRKVWACTFTSAIVCSIFGMWQAMHWLPGLPGL